MRGTGREIEAELAVLKLQFLRLAAKNIHYQVAGSQQMCESCRHQKQKYGRLLMKPIFLPIKENVPHKRGLQLWHVLAIAWFQLG